MPESKIIIDGSEYPVPEKLTLGEAADVEEITGQAYDPGKPGAKMTLAILYVAMRRADPAVKLEDVRDLDLEGIDFKEADAGPPAKKAPELAGIPEPSGVPS